MAVDDAGREMFSLPAHDPGLHCLRGFQVDANAGVVTNRFTTGEGPSDVVNTNTMSFVGRRCERVPRPCAKRVYLKQLRL